ncbi:uncharacterized protein LOC127729138 [Mytilus californianus]|uniref:uncharacterized protein LOC127729138 n=1 Tax=Mytilus californianus TaxID=6549 RepID=UPI0022461277|nr:uncharacterized protein LOC127729138 [Mytilus californianus]
MADSELCDGCQCGNEDIKVVSWCSDCSELVCNACARVHERMSPPHKVVPMKEIQQLCSSLLKLSQNCDNHPDQKIELFCCQHDKVICDLCVPVLHLHCKPIISIENAARGVKDGTAISDVERRMDNLSKVTDTILSKTEITLEDLKKSRNNIKKRVSDIKQKVIAHLDKIEAGMHKDIDNKYKYCNDTVSRNKNSVKSSSDSLSTWKRDLKSLKQHTSEIHLFQAVKFLDTITHQKELKIREIQEATVPILTYHPSEYESNMTKLIRDLGTITVDTVSVPMPALDIDQQGQFLVRDKRQLSLAHSFHTSKLGGEVRITRGCFIPGERLLLCHKSKRKLYVCKLDGSKSKVINLDYNSERLNLYDNNHALVSLGSGGIQMIDLKKLKPRGIIKVDGNCYGITSVKDKIWVNHKSNTLIIDITGKVLNTKPIQTTFDPYNICSNKDGDVIYCTDFASDKVFVVTSGGNERVIYSSHDLGGARGVAVDDRGDVYIAGFISNNIHRISNDGHDIVLTADDGINEPTDLSYNCETRELLVINNNLKSVNIIKYNEH